MRRPGPPPTVAFHPQATHDPATLRWVVTRVELPFVGRLVGAPGLDELLDDLVERIDVGTGDLLVRLRAGASWAEAGPRVRRALSEALGRTPEWVGDEDARRLGPDETLHECARELIDGPVGEIATLHGGSIELVSASEGVVRVRMHGACRGCPAAVITMHRRLEQQLRRRVPDMVGVEEIG